MHANALAAPARHSKQTPPPDSPVRRSTAPRPRVPNNVTAGAQDAILGALIGATAGHDERAFERLYRLTSKRLLAVSTRIVRDRGLAEDVLQEAYLVIWQHAGQWRPERPPLAWLITVVRYRAIDRLRRLRRECLTTASSENVTAEPASDPYNAIDAAGLRADLHARVRSLPPNQRNAVLAAFYDGLTHAEVAARLGVPLGTAKSWIRRGLARVGRHLDADTVL